MGILIYFCSLPACSVIGSKMFIYSVWFLSRVPLQPRSRDHIPRQQVPTASASTSPVNYVGLQCNHHVCSPQTPGPPTALPCRKPTEPLAITISSLEKLQLRCLQEFLEPILVVATAPAIRWSIWGIRFRSWRMAQCEIGRASTSWIGRGCG